jgi:hypothetical protein
MFSEHFFKYFQMFHVSTSDYDYNADTSSDEHETLHVIIQINQARIVKYKKHKRPNHFNFWITGLQKTLGHYNDVRQVGKSRVRGYQHGHVTFVEKHTGSQG